MTWKVEPGLITSVSGWAITDGDRHIATPASEANAEFIVRACNAHDDLLAACKTLLTAIGEGQIDKQSRPFGERITYVKILREVIDKCEGKEAGS